MEARKLSQLEGALGVMLINFQAIEFYLTGLAWGLVGEDHALGKILTSHVRFNQLVEVCFHLVSYRTSSDQILVEEFRGLAKRASDLSKLRNRYVHSKWLDPEDGVGETISFTISLSRAEGIVESHKDVNHREVAEVANQMWALSNDLGQFIVKLAALKICKIPVEIVSKWQGA